MTKALLSIIGGLLLLGVGVYLLLYREKFDLIDKKLKQTQKDIKDLEPMVNKLDSQLKMIDKPLALVNKYSSKIVSFMRNE